MEYFCNLTEAELTEFIKRYEETLIGDKPTSILCVSGGTAIRMYLKYEDDAFHIYNKIDEVWDTYTLSEFISKNKLLIKCMEKGTLMRE